MPVLDADDNWVVARSLSGSTGIVEMLLPSEHCDAM